MSRTLRPRERPDCGGTTIAAQAHGGATGVDEDIEHINRRRHELDLASVRAEPGAKPGLAGRLGQLHIALSESHCSAVG